MSLTDPKYETPARDRPCDYCGAPNVITANGRSACRQHSNAAIDNVKPMQDIKTAPERHASD